MKKKKGGKRTRSSPLLAHTCFFQADKKLTGCLKSTAMTMSSVQNWPQKRLTVTRGVIHPATQQPPQEQDGRIRAVITSVTLQPHR